MILREGICLENRWEYPTCLYNDSNTKIQTEELAPPFKCDDCEFEGLFFKRLKIHKGKQHNIGAEVDSIDDIYIFDL